MQKFDSDRSPIIGLEHKVRVSTTDRLEALVFQFGRLKIEGIDAGFPISILVFQNHQNWKSSHTFVAKVFADFRFESLLQSLQRLSTKVCKYFRPFESLQKTFLLNFPSICRLSWKVFADFGGNNPILSKGRKYLQTLEETVKAKVCKYFRHESMIVI